MALQILTLSEMLAHSALAEVQALTEQTLTVLEAQAIDLLEGELGRRITLDTENITKEVSGSGTALLSLPERLNSIASVISVTGEDLTGMVETRADGWLLRATYPNRITFKVGVRISGKWGWTCPDKARRVLMDICEAMAMRKDDMVTRRDELTPWGSVQDGAMSANRGSREDRVSTMEELLRYDAKTRLWGCYRPSVIMSV